MDSLINLLVAAVLAGTPLLFGTLGEILTEKSGNLNLGVEGIMFMGGVAGLAGAYYYERAVQSPSGVLALIIALVPNPSLCSDAMSAARFLRSVSCSPRSFFSM